MSCRERSSSVGASAIVSKAIEGAIDEFDGFEDAAGRFTFPDLAKAAGAQPFNEAVAANRFGIRAFFNRHGGTLGNVARCLQRCLKGRSRMRRCLIAISR